MKSTPSAPVFLCSELVKVRYTHHSSTSLTLVANLEEISRHGASLLSEAPLCEGASVDILCRNKQVLRGKVSSLTSDELGYTTWVEFDANSQWSPERFRPRHLLDPNSLRAPINKVA